MQQDRATGAKSLVDCRGHRRRGRAGGPVEPPGRPQHGPQAQLSRGDQGARRKHPVGRPQPPRPDAGDVGDQLGRAREVVVQARGRTAQETAVVPAVHRDLVPGSDDLAPELRATGELTAEHEKRRSRPGFRQQRKETRRRAGMRPVVERKRDMAGVAHSRQRGGAQGRQEQRGRSGVAGERGQSRRADHPATSTGMAGTVSPASAARTAGPSASGVRTHGTVPSWSSTAALARPWPGRQR